MRYEKSYGIIPLAKQKGEWHVLLVQQRHGQHWGFPKGHADKKESPQAAAIRELYEETGLTVDHFLSLDMLEETYFFKREGRLTHKAVYYFIAEVSNYTATPTFQDEELTAIKWVPLKEADKHITHQNAKKVAIEAQQIVLKEI